MRPLIDKRDREETLREWQQVSDRHKQTETDMLSELATVHHCAWDHAKNTSLVSHSGARRRDTHMEKETEIKHKRERERHRMEKTVNYQAHRVEATRKSPRSSKTVMKRTASLRFAAHAPQ